MSAAHGEVQQGNSIQADFDGTGCSAGTAGTEYSSTVLNITAPSAKFLSTLHHGDTIDHSTSVDLTSAFQSLPDSCDGIELTLSAEGQTPSQINNMVVDSVDITNEGTTTIGEIKTSGSHTLNVKLTVNTSESTDLAQNLSYIIPVRISLTTTGN